METGDWVSGTPLDDDVVEFPEKVIGRLEFDHIKSHGLEWDLALVWVKDSDGDEIPVECETDSLALAGRREKETVL